MFRTLEGLPSKNPMQHYNQVKTLDRRKRIASRKSSSRRGELFRQFSSGEDYVDTDARFDDVNSEGERMRRLQAVKALTGSLETKRIAR